jgi:crossover junction endodeoxyribonuclease RuvC
LKQLILGVDPGSRRCGFGLLSCQRDRVEHVDHGVIVLNEKWPLAERLVRLQAELSGLYARFPITSTVVEKVFFGKNADSAFVLGHARGVCLLVSAQHQVPIAEYAARYVKKCVTGSGAASKDHVQMVVFNLLRVRAPEAVAYDASDALSLALTHARVQDVQSRLDRAALEDSL